MQNYLNMGQKELKEKLGISKFSPENLPKIKDLNQNERNLFSNIAKLRKKDKST